MDILSYNISLSLNVVKSVLFRASSILLQFAIYKLFTLLASRAAAYTSYLMLHEAIYQKILYVISRGFHYHSLLVIGFVALFGTASMWDTMLWALDNPGFVMYQTRTTAAGLQANLRSDADSGYVVSAGTNNGLDGLNLPRDMGEGLWEGVNVTLAGIVDIGIPQIVSTKNYNKTEFLKGPGPRIWLDEDGLSVMVDSTASVTQNTGCITDTDVGVERWSCESDHYRSQTAINYFMKRFAQPVVYWEAGLYLDSNAITPERGINPWHVMGTGGDSVVMKEVFTVTKGTRRHVFLMTAWKATIITEGAQTMSFAEVEDLVDRTWQKGRADAERRRLLNDISSAMGHDRALHTGKRTESGYGLNSRVYQLLKGVNIISNQTVYTDFQVSDANVTLIRSETISSSPVPFETCDTWFYNDARGGKARGTSCSLNVFPGRGTRFLGQVDVSTVLVLEDTLGQRLAPTSSAALNETAWVWLNTYNHEIDAFVLSRGYILGVSPEAVQVDSNNYKPAASILQFILAAVPFVVAAAVYALVLLGAKLNYQTSLLTNLVATTYAGYDCKKPEYMKNPPDVFIVGRGDVAYLGTETGVFWHTGRETPEGFGHTPGALTWTDVNGAGKA